MADSGKFLPVELKIKEEFFTKTTDKAWCFHLWGKKFTAFPKSVCTGFEHTDGYYLLMMPVWYIEKNSLRSLVDEDIRDTLFPLKGRKKKVNLTPNMFDQFVITEPIEKSSIPYENEPDEDSWF